MNQKYLFQPYSSTFPDLFQKECQRIERSVNRPLLIEHVGSTAVPLLGGKGIIDIAIAIDQREMKSLIRPLQLLGYTFKPDFSTPDRLYFVTFLPDCEREWRRYHIHLTFPESQDWKGLIGFRDYLRSHPEAILEYEEIKKQAVFLAEENGEKYRAIKEPFIKKIYRNIGLS
ncbi:Glutamate-rich protein grpB [Chlamydiales bacterium STE3]|nr:Glutamate-rich protein grpB [Chlamydiales bacterium STE3]